MKLTQGAKEKQERYSMGNGKEVTDPNEATDLFLRREFPEIANCEKVPHIPVFVPDIFIFNSVKPEVRSYIF